MKYKLKTTSFMKTDHPNIYYVILSSEDFSKVSNLFYFSDEADQLNGPFLTKKACLDAFDEYVEDLKSTYRTFSNNED